MFFRPAPFPLLWPLTLLACLGFGLLALALGMDASWDLRNYHYYNGWRLLNGLVERDALVAQIPSFFNPLLDVPYAWAVDNMPARWLGFTLGAVHGLNFGLLFAIAWTLLEVRNPSRRALAAAALALAGVTGAGGLSLVGTVFWDNVISLGILASVLVVVRNWDDLSDAPPGWAAILALLAALPAGLAFGLKQPSVIFCVGLCFAFLPADLAVFRRFWLAFWFGIGVLLGLALGGGYWMSHLWHTYGNPLFPFFNHVFQSPWGAPEPYRDPGFLQTSLVDMLTFGFRFPFEPTLAAEVEFRDFRILAVLVVVPLAALASLARRRGSRDLAAVTRAGPSGWLMAAAMITFVIWVVLFCIYRYLIPLEMLAPIVVVAACGTLPLSRAARRGLGTALVVFLVASTQSPNWLRVPWQERAVSATIPAVPDPAGTLVLISGHEPLSFLVPLFPKEMRFLRIDSTFTLADDPQVGFRRLFTAAIAGARGAIASLHITTEQGEVVKKLAAYGLALDQDSCRTITSPIGAAPYAFCLTRRLPAAVPPAAEAPSAPAAAPRAPAAAPNAAGGG